MVKFRGFTLFGVRFEVAFIKGSRKWLDGIWHESEYYRGKMRWFQFLSLHLRIDRRG